jgi:DNA-binding NtrC family response regulator
MAVVSPDNQRPTVLLVDDEEDILESLALMFRLAVKDLRLVTAKSGQEALEILRRERVDLIVTDYRMPVMDGFQFLKAADAVHAGLPRIMITAYPDPALAARAQAEAEVAMVISKPFDLDTFMQLCRSLVARSKRLR